ncbi:hypothetical protein ACIQPP_17560 [Streptomyces violaceusniger]|uniref:hypothetical protein n=1 Tax=Streptomyces violaceusniger TaxID=68280 RepID=UPI000996DFAC|nr:hypothetical protein [Streptomyces hygroscopicus]AQW49447.1 hypothetical protein SHXM_02910 [Streptomyces hygroscopicus]
MASGQLPAEVEEFARYLRALTRRLDAGTGWYGVFALRDPEGLRACLDGLEVPPWDVVQSLLQDLSTQRGVGTAQEAAARAATLYRASVAAHDAGPGSREALRDRLDGMLREQRNADRRERDLQAALSAAEAAADRERLGAELAWAHDDWRRATARTEELHARLTALGSRPSHPPAPEPVPPAAPTPPTDPTAPAPAPWPTAQAGPTPTAPALAPWPTAPAGPTPTAPALAPRPLAPTAGPMAPGTSASGVGSGADASFEPPVQGREPMPPAPAAASPRPRGARFAGVEEVGTAPRPRGARFAGAGGGGTAAPPPSSPAPPSAESGSEVTATPRGARFAGAYDGEGGGKRRRRDKAADDGRRLAREAAERAAARRAAQEAVARLGRLRAAGRSGEAHVVLCEAAAWPAPRLPVLAEELERAGLGADVSTLLWEMACLPPARLAAAAEALVAADREADGERLLRQSVSRPVPEVAHTTQALLAAGAPYRAAFLLEALVRARTPEEVARAAAEDPATLVPLLLDAAAGVSSSSHHDLAHALRAAGLPGVPGLA